MAERHKTLQAVQLGSWSFVAFVESPCQSQMLHIKASHSQIFFLAWHKETQMLQLMMLEQDPWAP